MSKHLKSLTNNIDRILERLDRRPSWLAQKSGVPAPNLSRLLRGEGNPTLSTLIAIANALEVEVEELISQDDYWEMRREVNSADAEALIKKAAAFKKQSETRLRADSVLRIVTAIASISDDKLDTLASLFETAASDSASISKAK